MIVRCHSESAVRTRALGEAVGRAVRDSLALLLTGDYGTGKTTFVQGLARGLDIGGPIRSPSYNILKRYQGRLTLVHADLYRTRSEHEIAELGLEEIMAESGVLAVEWPGGFLPAGLELPVVCAQFAFATESHAEQVAESARVIEFSWQERLPPELEAALHALAA